MKEIDKIEFNLENQLIEIHRAGHDIYEKTRDVLSKVREVESLINKAKYDIESNQSEILYTHSEVTFLVVVVALVLVAATLITSYKLFWEKIPKRRVTFMLNQRFSDLERLDERQTATVVAGMDATNR